MPRLPFSRGWLRPLAILTLLAPVAASAQDAPQQDIEVRAPLPGTPQAPATLVLEPVAMMIATFDANGDGMVDRAELTAGVKHSFDAIDTAHQGYLRYIAFADWAEKWLGNRAALPSPFEVDRNQDDKVTLDELQDHFGRLFARYDRNGDHLVSRAELLTYRTGPVDANGPTAGRGFRGKKKDPPKAERRPGGEQGGDRDGTPQQP